MPNTAYSNAFGYDAMGNRVRHETVRGSDTMVTTATPNALNQLTALSHTADGISSTSKERSLSL